MRIENCSLPSGYLFRVRVFGRPGAIHRRWSRNAWHIVSTEFSGDRDKALCGRNVAGYRSLTQQEAKDFAKGEQGRYEACYECMKLLRTTLPFDAMLTEDQLKNVLGLIGVYFELIGAEEACVQACRATDFGGPFAEDLREALGRAVGLPELHRKAVAGQIINDAVVRGQRLHPWESRDVMLEAIKAEVAELEEAHHSGDTDHARTEAIDVIVTAYRYADGQ